MEFVGLDGWGGMEVGGGHGFGMGVRLKRECWERTRLIDLGERGDGCKTGVGFQTRCDG